MKAVSQQLFDVFRKEHVINEPQVRVYAEWNHNRFSDILSVQNEAVTDLYEDLFPVKSIAESFRPYRSGIYKIVDDNNHVPASIGWAPLRTRAYAVDEDDVYKYWVSVASNAVAEADFSYQFSASVKPSVLYTSAVPSNKIVIVVENGYVNLEHYTVEISTNGTTWTTVATEPTVSIDGRIELYRQAAGTWTTAFSTADPLMIRGVRLNVTAVDEPNTHLGVIEVSARVVYDLSEFVEEINTDFEMSDYSLVAPLGVASANQATLSLSNTDQRFNNENAESPFFGMLDRGAEFTVDLGFDTTPQGGAGVEYVRMATMLSETWSGQTSLSVDVSLSDSSTWLRTRKPPKTLFQNQTIGSIIWTLCDLVGFNKYLSEDTPEDYGMRVPYFWTTGEESVWEVIGSLCEMTQSAAWFDEYDVLNIRSRTSAFDTSQAVQWNLDAVPVGEKLPDLIEASSTQLGIDNSQAEVFYTPTKISEFNNGFPKMEVVWQPEDLVLRGTALLKPITTGTTSIFIDPKEAATWPYEGRVNIDGELISYKGKKYYYWTDDGVRHYQYINSQEEKDNIDDTLSGTIHNWRNAFAGDLIITGRNLKSTRGTDHGITATPEVAKKVITDGVAGSVATTLGSFANSQFTVATPSTWQSGKNNMVLSYGTVDTVKDRYYGTRLKFNPGVGPETNGEAGVWLGGSTQYNGYYISLFTTGLSTNTAGAVKEVTIFRRTTSGALKIMAQENAEVLFGKWYDLDVHAVREATQDTLVVYLNGVKVASAVMAGADRVGSNPEKTGVYVGTWTSVSFEHYYTVAAQAEMRDFPTFLDLVQKGYQSGLVTRNLLVSRVGAFGTLQTRGGNQRAIFDDFGSIVHESRDFDVKFEPAPVIHSNLYFSNEIEAVTPEYTADPFGARFTIENTARKNAILMGTDESLFVGESVEQKTFVYGRRVTQDDPQKETFKNDDAIRRRGEIIVEYNSPWIQTKEAATALGDWLVSNWDKGIDEVEAEVFGNPMLQIGDLVSLNYPDKNMDPDTHQYFIIKTNSGYKEGLITRLTLLRRKL